MSPLRRYVPLLIGGAALFAAACRDSTAPTTTSELVALGDRSYTALVSPSDHGNAVSTTFDIPAQGGQAKVGEFTLTFPANSVCDPQTSGYGPTTWKLPCETIDRDFPITARLFQVNGESHVEFQPDIRFHPDKQVTIEVIRTEIIGQRLTLRLAMRYNIWMTKQMGDTRFYIDEAFYDWTLRTHFDTTTGRVSRRIRHFSGWVIRTGYCTENPTDPECVEGGLQ